MLSTGFGCVLIRNVETRCDVLCSRLVAGDWRDAPIRRAVGSAVGATVLAIGQRSSSE